MRVTRQSLGALISSIAAAFPTVEALAYAAETMDWRELDRTTNQGARLLASKGVGLGDYIAITLPNGVAFHQAVVAVWKAGATPLMVPTKAALPELREILTIANPRLVIGPLPEGFADLDRIAAAIDPTLPDTAVSDVAPLYWKAVTSGGSSGRPKIIVDHMSGMIDPDDLPFKILGLDPNAVMLNPGPLYHNLPFLMSHWALLAGARVVGMTRFDPEEALRLIEAHRVTFVSFVPTMMHRIWALPPEVRNRYDLSSLRSVWHMAAPCAPWLKRAWIDWLGPERIWEAYAGTESSGTAISGEEWLRKPGSVGRVEAGTLKVVDAEGRDCAPNEVGEILFPPGAAERFHYLGTEAPALPEQRLNIGDLGYLDEDGYLFLADRRTDLIIRGGANVYPAEVEAALEEHPDVESSIVIGLPCDDLGQRVHALVHLRSGLLTKIEDIASFIEPRLSKYKWPQSYELVDKPLRDDAGKVRRSALRAERMADTARL
jgi:bile acid-coenzyme A ligase